jgi:hypothetical protein
MAVDLIWLVPEKLLLEWIVFAHGQGVYADVLLPTEPVRELHLISVGYVQPPKHEKM